MPTLSHTTPAVVVVRLQELRPSEVTVTYKKVLITGYFEADDTGYEPQGTVEALMRLGITDIDVQTEEAEEE